MRSPRWTFGWILTKALALRPNQANTRHRHDCDQDQFAAELSRDLGAQRPGLHLHLHHLRGNHCRVAATIAVGVVYNSARIVLAERAWELASLRVLGFSRGEVSSFLLGELAVEVIVGIPLGLWLGCGSRLYLTHAMHSDTFRIPVIIAPKTYVISIGEILASGLLSALIVRRRSDGLDLVGALKTRE